MTTRIEQLRSLVKQHDELKKAIGRVELEVAKRVKTYRVSAVQAAKLTLSRYDAAVKLLDEWNNPAVLIEDDDEEDDLEED